MSSGRRPAQRVSGSVARRATSPSFRRFCPAQMASEPLCRYCRAAGRITAARVVEHITALSLGGTNDRANLAPACRECNEGKRHVEQLFAAAGYNIGDVALYF